MMPWMHSKVLNRELGLRQETMAGRVGGDGDGNAAESPCGENAIFQKHVCVLKLRFGLSPRP